MSEVLAVMDMVEAGQALVFHFFMVDQEGNCLRGGHLGQAIVEPLAEMALGGGKS